MRAMLCAAAALPASHAAVRILESEGSGAQQTLPLRLEEGSSESALSADLKKGLQKQWLRGLDEHGESITIMAVGEAGVGKTTLFSNLFLRDLSSPPGPTHTILEQTVHFDLDGIPFSAKLVDTPGYGDALDLRRTFALATNYLDSCFSRSLAQERAIRRNPVYKREQNLGVDVILYFFPPHRAKAIDYAFLRRLQGRASIVPILSKADTMTSEELESFSQQVTTDLEKAGIQVAHPPIAIICASDIDTPPDMRGRRYPWGFAPAEREGFAHSGLPRLRRFLLIEGLLPLRETSREHYEAYRRHALRRSQMGISPIVRNLLPPAPLLLALVILPQTRKWLKLQLLPACISQLCGVTRALTGNTIGKLRFIRMPWRLRSKSLPKQTPPPPPRRSARG